jgi:sporulation protein YunB
LFPGPRWRPLSRWQRFRLRLIAALVLSLGFLIPAGLFFRTLAGRAALSDAKDAVTLAVSESVREMMEDGQYGYEYFVTLSRDNSGNISAITTNVGRINTLSASLLGKVVNASDTGELDLKIPLGNLLGSNILLGRGPMIPVKIILLTSSYADFRNELVSAGINQTRHQILLDTVVNIDVLLPWQVLSPKVPETYLNLDRQEG